MPPVAWPGTPARPARSDYWWTAPAIGAVLSAGFAAAMFVLQLHPLFVIGVVLFVVMVAATVLVARGK
jgi:hypothetical protein